MEPVDLRALRRQRGKSLRQMAEEIGGTVNFQILQRAERGISTPRPENQVLIARAYGLDVLVQWPEPDTQAA